MKSADDETRLELDQGLKDLRGILAGGGKGPARPAAAPAAGTASVVSDEEMDDEDEDEDEDDEAEGDSDEDEESDAGSTYELNDDELEAALAAASSKSGVDRDLLRKLIGSAADRSESPEPAPAASSSIDLANAPAADRPPPAAAPLADDDDSRDPYDLYVRQLALEPRAQATNRLKTPLELAQEAAETLRAQEARRLKRQRGEADLSSGSEDEGEGAAKKRKEKKRAPQGDDLEDDYLEEQFGAEGEEQVDEDEGTFGMGLEGEGTRLGDDDEDEAEGSEEGSEEEGSDEDEDEDEGSDDEMDVGDLDEPDSDDEAAGAGETEALVASTSAKFDQAGELPYTFPCPSSHAEFARLLRSSGIRDEDTVVVVKRIRTLYHPGLAEGNKDKLQVFANVLLDHVIFLSASSPSPSTYRTVNSLLPPLLTLTHAYPLTSAPHYIKKLSLMHKNLLRGLVRGPLDPAAKTWPGLAELTLLRLVGMVWSTSDLSHPVAAPALLLIGEYLSQARVRSLSDLASGLFLCTLAAQYESLAHRVVPEAVNFLGNALALLLPVSSSVVSATTFPGSFPTPDVGQEHTKALKLRASAAAQALAPSASASVNLVEALGASKGKLAADKAEQLKVDLVASALALVETYRSMYADSEAFPELFSPLESVLKAVKVTKVFEALRVRPLEPLVLARSDEKADFSLSFSRAAFALVDPLRAQQGASVRPPVAQAALHAAPQADPARDVPAQVRRGLQPEPAVRPGLGARRGEQAARAVQEGEEGRRARAAQRQPVPRCRGGQAQEGRRRAVREEGASPPPPPPPAHSVSRALSLTQWSPVLADLQDRVEPAGRAGRGEGVRAHQGEGPAAGQGPCGQAVAVVVVRPPRLGCVSLLQLSLAMHLVPRAGFLHERKAVTSACSVRRGTSAGRTTRRFPSCLSAPLSDQTAMARQQASLQVLAPHGRTTTSLDRQLASLDDHDEVRSLSLPPLPPGSPRSRRRSRCGLQGTVRRRCLRSCASEGGERAPRRRSPPRSVSAPPHRAQPRAVLAATTSRAAQHSFSPSLSELTPFAHVLATDLHQPRRALDHLHRRSLARPLGVRPLPGLAAARPRPRCNTRQRRRDEVGRAARSAERCVRPSLARSRQGHRPHPGAFASPARRDALPT